MKNTYLCIRVFTIVCLSLILICGFSVSVIAWNPIKDVKRKARSAIKETEKAVKKTANFITGENEAKWYSDYRKGKKAAEKEDWATAIELFKTAIKQEPKPKTWRVKGEEAIIGYYPYLKLGMAYLAIGDLKAAQENCETSKEKGVAPKEEVDKCLASIAEPTENKQIVKPGQTSTLASIPPSQSPASAAQADAVPLVVVTSKLPAETDSELLTIEGVVADDHGITGVNVSVRKMATKAIVAVNRAQIIGEQFKIDVQLEMGQNEIVVEATDTIGQVGKRIYTILRVPPKQSDIASARSSRSAPIPEGAPVALPQRQRNVYAVVIGIGNFQDERIPPLRFTVNDAQGFYDVLTDPNYGGVPKDHVQLLLDEDATDRKIKRAIGRWLSRQAKEEDTVIIYYSGHGAPEEDEKYWVTYNADIDDLYSTALSNNEVHDMLSRVESKRMITFLDSCYSAATVKRKDRTRNIKVEVPWDKFSGEGKVAISASNGTQLSLELEAYEHGVFTYYLLEGLKGRADGAAGAARDGMIEVEELWNYVRNTVAETAKKQGNTQNPVFQGSLTAGIPLTYDLAYLEELQRKRSQEKQEKQAKLQKLFEQGKIRAGHFDCAFQMIDAGKSNGYLDGLLAGEISPKTFGRLFKCDSQQ